MGLFQFLTNKSLLNKLMDTQLGLSLRAYHWFVMSPTSNDATKTESETLQRVGVRGIAGR